ncbi:aspartate kinase [Candidatus Cytomitobacter indipagum]|uniref:Aspartokinase n=1 Tax=Candidatus Cytomitobacter indipagum TaxID=2601575 RepID=A0A5C0UG76_9PROT|nr:aspartate kinase [Candidatus Cytomitobacter indipagum]QEK38044.1 aspartate kinase [Candidatus Cytomitobacter indipagum]
MKRCLVMKFGGATVADIDKIKHCIKKISPKFNEHSIIIVVSAMNDTTNQLRDLISQISSENECALEKHSGNLNSIKKYSNIASDLILSSGETISAGVFSLCLQDCGYKSIPLCGWQLPIVTDDNYGDAEIQQISMKYIKELINQKTIPVVAGFQGISPSKNITTLGESSSDLTAVAIAAELNADCYIYKNVSGVFTCDPNSNSGKKIDSLSYENMEIASKHGAKVVCYKAVKYAKKHNVKIFVESAFQKESGTMISNNFSQKNIVTSQQAFIIPLENHDPIPSEHIFTFGKWCIFSNQEEFENYALNNNKNISKQKYMKITLIHPSKIAKDHFLNIAKKYSEIYSCMDSYSWICIEKKYASNLEKDLHESFVK